MNPEKSWRSNSGWPSTSWAKWSVPSIPTTCSTASSVGSASASSHLCTGGLARTRAIVTLSLAILIGSVASRTVAQQPKKEVPPRVVSPEVHADKKVTFRINAPKATEVTVRGDWMSGPPEKLSKDEKGVWSVTVGPLTPDFYSYGFTVDGIRTLDPVNATIKQGI